MIVTRTYETHTSYLLDSSDLIEKLFIEDCKRLGLTVRVRELFPKRKALCTLLYKVETAQAAYLLLKEEGHDVYMAPSLFYPDKWCVVLGK